MPRAKGSAAIFTKAFLGLASLSLLVAGAVTLWGPPSRWFGPPPKPIAEVIFVPSPSGLPALPEAELKAPLTELMADLPGFAFALPRSGAVPWSLSLGLRARTPQPGPDPQPAEDPDRKTASPELWLQLRAMGQVTAGPSEISEATPFDANTGFETALQALGAQLKAKLRWFEAPEADLLNALQVAQDAKTKASLIEIIALRKLSAALSTLIPIMDDPSEPLSMRFKALGALVAIRDPAAVKAIIKHVDLQVLARAEPFLFALGQIGGEEAQGFLFTLAQGHADPRFREVAREALGEAAGVSEGESEGESAGAAKAAGEAEAP